GHRRLPAHHGKQVGPAGTGTVAGRGALRHLLGRGDRADPAAYQVGAGTGGVHAYRRAGHDPALGRLEGDRGGEVVTHHVGDLAQPRLALGVDADDPAAEQSLLDDRQLLPELVV